MATYELNLPLCDKDIENLRIGDTVYLNGPAYTCRSMLHKYVFDEGHELPVNPEKYNALIHTGPIMKQADGKWKVLSFMPTSSIRFEKWGARSVKEWKLKLILGKTTMGEDTMSMMKKMKCVHITPQSVSTNTWIDCIDVDGVHYYDELGSIEATWLFHLSHLGPFVVDIDCEGNNLFDELYKQKAERVKEAYSMIGIPEDMKFTKLY
ncbi:MAG: fumarate hydratase C-terminal domain-containing protein [Clostridia bacterium]|nr:fumarate hydratase C-terminal domain-containing protein [Clostridia bacterium]